MDVSLVVPVVNLPLFIKIIDANWSDCLGFLIGGGRILNMTLKSIVGK